MNTFTKRLLWFQVILLEFLTTTKKHVFWRKKTPYSNILTFIILTGILTLALKKNWMIKLAHKRNK